MNEFEFHRPFLKLWRVFEISNTIQPAMEHLGSLEPLKHLLKIQVASAPK